MSDEVGGALTQLRAYLAQHDLPANAQLPPERELCDLLGVSRGELRKALAVLEGNGELWRHVGKGTFIGARPVEEFKTVADLAAASNPREIMEARLAIEPILAREAALHATSADIAEMRQCLEASRLAETWRQYENCDNRLHRLVAEASHNTVLIALFDTLNAVRRAVVWGRLRHNGMRPPPDHHSFHEHELLVEAITERDLKAAALAMDRHLRSVEANLLRQRQAAE
ncbi:FadR/GntR family transcriptional regulator [Taklimakanibacter deserti]|uniref:FadR/GntR family transcriptional regulator n=1 Tax=Taklimakanibacter deserti TaxID=2267839 RepID=UPI000E655CFE